MKKLMRRLRNAIRKWLGIGEIFMGVDVSGSQRDQSCIIIVSKLGNGSVRIIDSHFSSISEIEHLVKHLQQSYGIPYHNIYKDIPKGIQVNF